MDAPDASPPPTGATPYDAEAPPDLTPRMVTRLVVFGENIQLDLPPEQERFTLGAASAPAVDLTVRGEQVSRLHAILTRKGAKLRVVDQKSTNGTFRHGGYRDPDFEVSPGETFEVSRRVKLLALDPGLAILRQRLLWVLGLRNRIAADEAIQHIAKHEPILLIGPPGCEQLATAGEIHRRSAFNDREFVIAPPTFASRTEQVQVLTRGDGSNVFVDLTRATAPLPAFFVGRLFDKCRPIIAVTSREQALEALDKYADRARTLDLATPADRPDDIPRLLDALIIEEHARTGGGGELLPVAALGAANVDALKAHPWPDHFVELRAHARRLHAVLTNGLRIRASARALGLKSPSSLVEALERIGVYLKPIDADDVPGTDMAAEVPTPPGAPTRP